MRKTFEYNGLEMTIFRTYSYGNYKLTANVNGRQVGKIINDASIYDWCDDDSDPEKHEQAKIEAYGYITRAIEAAD